MCGKYIPLSAKAKPRLLQTSIGSAVHVGRETLRRVETTPGPLPVNVNFLRFTLPHGFDILASALHATLRCSRLQERYIHASLQKLPKSKLIEPRRDSGFSILDHTRTESNISSRLITDGIIPFKRSVSSICSMRNTSRRFTPLYFRRRNNRSIAIEQLSKVSWKR